MTETKQKIRVVIAGGSSLFLEGLRLILEQYGHIELVGEAAGELEKINSTLDLQPDVLLLDLNMPEWDAIPFLSSIKLQSPATKPLVIAASMDEGKIMRALEAGARGYLSMEISPAMLVKAIESVHRGELWVGRRMIAKFVDLQTSMLLSKKDPKEDIRNTLTQREQEILRLLTKGSSNMEIACHLFISEKTVKTHLSNIFRKLNVSRRLQAILYALKQGLA